MNDLDTTLGSLDTEVTQENLEEKLEEVNETLDEEVTKVDRKDVDYTTDSECVLFSTEALVKILSQLSTIIDLISPRKVSRGLNFVVGSDKLTVITPNELHYFKAELSMEKCTFEEGTTFWVDYNFLTKMTRFLPLKVLIYRKEGVYYLRLVTGDLELIDTSLIDSDLNKLRQDWDVLDTNMVLNKSEVVSSLGTLSKLYSFASDLPRRVFDVKDDLVQFMTPFVQATSALHFPEVRLIPPVVNYLIKACSLCSAAGNVELHNTSSETIPRYAIVFDNITMITNYAGTKFDVNSKAVKSLLPEGTAIQFNEVKYIFDYVNSITYASGNVTLKVKGDKIIGKIKLNNNNESLIEIPVISKEVALPKDLSAVVNAKDLAKAFGTLDVNLTTYIGYVDGLIYLWNDNVILTIMTFGG